MSEIILYKNQSDRKKINKNITEIVDITDTFRIKENTSIINPTVILSRETVGKRYASVNYAYIPMWNRYYFVDDIVVMNDTLLSLTMTCDVLMTYRDTVMSTPQEIVRAEALNSELYIDTERPIQSNKLLDIVKIGDVPMSVGNNYAFTVAGGIGVW